MAAASSRAASSFAGTALPSSLSQNTAAAHEPPAMEAEKHTTSSAIALQRRGFLAQTQRAVAMAPLPALTCSFPSKLHPLYENVRADCDQWVEMVVDPASSDCSQHWRQCLLPRLACLFMPTAPSRWRLVQAMKLLTWLLIDMADRQSWTRPFCASTQYRTERILGILREPLDRYEDRRLWNYDLLDGRLPRQSSRRIAALADLWRLISPDMSPLLRSRFICSMADYLQGMTMQAALRGEEGDAGMEAFISIRRQAFFTTAGFVLLEYAIGVELQEAALENPHFIKLRQKAADYIILSYDFASFCKEIRPQGDSAISLAPILHRRDMIQCRSRASLEEVTDRMARLITDTEARCASLMASLKEEHAKACGDRLQASRVHAYVDAVAMAMSGAVTWLLETTLDTHKCTAQVCAGNSSTLIAAYPAARQKINS